MEKIWVLIDDRVGNKNQAIGLADALNEPYITKKLNYNFFSIFPNFLLGKNDFYINKSTSDKLDPPFPELVISSGRRTAPIALRIKEKSPKTKIVQIMRPAIEDEKFDLIILPQHDKYYGTTNVYRTIGAINKITPQILEASLKEFRNNFSQLSLRIISVIIGGSSKRYKFNKKDADSLVSIIEQLVINHGAQVFISFSRRTPESTKESFYKAFSPPHYIYDPDKGGYNPYLGMIAACDFVIVTGDSISMCSDVITSGKPLYIYMSPRFVSTKHNYFVQQLVDLELAKHLLPITDVLHHYKYKPVAEAAKVAKYIRDNIVSF